MFKKLSIAVGLILLVLSSFSQSVTRGALVKKDTTRYKPDTTIKYQVIVDKDSNLAYYNGRKYFMLTAGGSSALPSQTGNAGKFLYTNGTIPSWLNPFDNPVLPALQHNSTATTKFWTLTGGKRIFTIRDDTLYQSSSFNGPISGGSYFLGRDAGNTTCIGGGNNIAVGDSALSSITNTFGLIGIGAKALENNTTGGSNTMVGHRAMMGNINGSYNTGLGTDVQRLNNGSYNTSIGAFAMWSATGASENTSIGSHSMVSATIAYRNTAIGVSSLSTITSGTNNTAVGGGSQTHTTTAVFNAGLGYHVAHYNTTGSYNTELGAYAGEQLNGGNYNTLIGYAQGQTMPASTSHLLLIGSHPHPNYTGDTTNAIIVGFMDSLRANQRLVINANVTVNGTINTSNILSGSATLNFPTFGANQANTLTITVTGAAIGDVVALGTPGSVGSSTTEGIIFWAYVSATNTVAIRAVNSSGTPLSPSPGVFTVKVFK